METTKLIQTKENEEVYSMQKLMYEYSRRLKNYSDPAIVKMSQKLDEKLNVIQRTKIQN
ncbi:Spo0E family sporulation regulatory protein-aspartic acid phosphatase [Pseudalkalibacillus salsuginis]|uniref:Spo0E family sporulation regulatory protein-aspartic acid phosphatase n=1 Tax=Pseudalkalibacillus salsuginis TaxID=2910972 RepID=UPI001F2C4A01|nr:Spo0E family sporulation regulatory protein-aspartic acid phosphatase [Pseudalkalibacillus salsuginis]MCF6411644.1 Spo0E family sporulation regulatory protein-aspartic acid phosphatase [Pseudalkalibacillus salsuginis]